MGNSRIRDIHGNKVEKKEKKSNAEIVWIVKILY